MEKLALVFKAIELVKDLIDSLSIEELSEEERTALKAKRDALNKKLDDLDVKTDLPPTE